MTTVYLIRHVQAQGNVDRVFQGHYDGKVSELGRRQLERLREACKELHFDCIYSSPLSRARETAKAANTYYNYSIQIDEGLIEINGGDWEQQKWSSFSKRDPEQAENWHLRPYEFCAPNGEAMKDVYTRIQQAVLRIVENNKDKTVCIVSHGGVLSCFFNWAMGRKPEELSKATICDNAAISKAVFDENLHPTLAYFNNTEHLGDALSVSASRLWKG